MVDILSKDSPIIDIYEYLDTTPSLETMETINQCLKNGLISQTTQSHILACALALKNTDLEDFLFSQENYGLREILKTCYVLDAVRYTNQMKRKYDILLKQNPPANAKKISRMKYKVEENSKMDQGMGSSPGFKLTGSKLKTIKSKWIKHLSKEKLEEYAMSMPVRQWQRLADMLHMAPTDFQLPWFLEYVYDTSKVPEDSVLYNFNKLTQDNVLDFVKSVDISYEHLRSGLMEKNITFDDSVKEILYNKCTPDKYLWYWEELVTDQNNNKFTEYLATVGDIEMSYGKLMERVLTVRTSGNYAMYKTLLGPAENRLNNLKVKDMGKVAILGDASSSMQIAINTSNIIASTLCSVCNAELRLFRSDDELLTSPTSVNDVIEMSKKNIAHSATAPAASLWPYYKSKTRVDIFIIVTDEEENTSHTGQSTWSYNKQENKGFMFAPLFKKYLEEVNSEAKLVFVSFTQPGVDGFMVTSIKEHIPGFDEKMLVFKMDTQRPDLSKLDKILTRLMEWK